MSKYLNNLTPLESKAFQICHTWEEVCQKELFNYNYMKLRKSGDPKKSLLFKYAYKLAVETQGLIPDADYVKYITAQIQVLKLYSADMSPTCLVGQKAWLRWVIWKSKFDKAAKVVMPNESVQFDFPTIKFALEKTKKFLIEKFGILPTFDQIQISYNEYNLIKWTAFGKISPFYILLSPHVAKICQTIKKSFHFDPKIYESSITPEVKNLFNELFNEF